VNPRHIAPLGREVVCHAPAEMECLQEYHPGKCKTRPCKHCSTGCMYWGRK
jgi:hypothetical protein